jgi:hypothetical protein
LSYLLLSTKPERDDILALPEQMQSRQGNDPDAHFISIGEFVKACGQSSRKPIIHESWLYKTLLRLREMSEALHHLDRQRVLQYFTDKHGIYDEDELEGAARAASLEDMLVVV